jgi:hypothetical protein
VNLSFIFATLTACCLLPFEGRIPVDQNTTEASTESYKGTSDLFDSDEVLHIKLSGNIRVLMADRLDNAVYHSLVLTYKGGDSNEVSINIKAKTRGNFRRKKENCKLPPILLNFTEESRKTLFNNQHKLKLVTPCQSDNYVIREYLVYKLYNLVTPKSFRVRLVSVTLNDTEKRKETSFYGILLEEDEQLAARSGLKILKDQKIRGEHTEQESFFKMALFQYMIGNTDWSVPYRHNIRVLAFDSLSIPYAVPYDFDHSGIVNAPYAMPPEELGLSSVQERRFRGYCMTDKKTLEEVIAFYKRKRDEFYNVYKGCRLIDARYVNSTQKFLDGFYETLNDPKKINAALAFPCDKNQPKIVVRGLNGQ